MTKKALLVGINDYAPVGPGGPDLRGCVPDVRDVAHTLVALGILPLSMLHFRIHTDSRATKANILKGLTWLVSGARKGDLLIFYYSGHGSQVVDPEGDEEIDHKDETICPHDYATAGMIKDDDLREIFKKVTAEVNLEVILDSCHAGSATRALPGESENSGMTIRYIEPPVDYGYFLEASPMLPTQRILGPKQGKNVADKAAKQVVIVPGLNHVLWAACRDYQTSAECPTDGTVRGAFTYRFCKALRRAGKDITRRKLDTLVSADLRKDHFEQVPQLEGTAGAIEEKVFT